MTSTLDGPAVRSSHTSPVHFRLQLLGSFALTADDAAIRLPAAAARVLAHVALAATGARRRVAAALWPDATEVRAQASLRTAVWRLGTAAPGVVEAHGRAVRLGAQVELDTGDLEEVARRLLWDEEIAGDRPAPSTARQRDAWRHALMSGDLLPSWDEDWLRAERERLRQLRLQALEAAVRRMLLSGRVDCALDLALEAVRCDPWRETARAALIRVHLSDGNIVEARRQYVAFRDVLRRELGISPTPALRELLDRA